MRTLLMVAVMAVSGSTLAAGAELGAAAPDFSLKDLDGKTVKLADFKGKTVVLEWFNPECPYVKASHTKGSLVDTAKKQTAKGIVWLSINSGAVGKQGAGVEKNREGVKTFAMSNPVLLDETGATGKAYGATNTPHVFVINKDGKLVYRGAIDNSPDGEGASPTGGTLVNYVNAALDDLAAGRPVKTNDTKAYGCGVKYGS
ncbi:MAG: thioredoxin family protein [Archangium sp.]|nr:thioredoxin family protein [Archangium sp.]